MDETRYNKSINDSEYNHAFVFTLGGRALMGVRH